MGLLKLAFMSELVGKIRISSFCEKILALSCVPLIFRGALKVPFQKYNNGVIFMVYRAVAGARIERKKRGHVWRGLQI